MENLFKSLKILSRSSRGHFAGFGSSPLFPNLFHLTFSLESFLTAPIFGMLIPMNVQVPRKQLADVLGNIERIIPSRSSNPGLSLISMMMGERGLTFSGSNMDIDIQATVQADVAGGGHAALPAHVFGQVVRSLPGELVELVFSDNELEISSGSYATKLQLADAATVPEVVFPEGYAGRYDGSQLADALNHVRYAAAVAEYQAIFRGVKVEFNDKRTRAVATDGFRLAYYHMEDASGLGWGHRHPGAECGRTQQITRKWERRSSSLPTINSRCRAALSSSTSN